MRRLLPLLVALLSGVAISLAGARSAPADCVADGEEVRVLGTFQLGGTGGWDYPTVDPDNHRLYIARDTRVMVVDIVTGRLVGEFQGLRGAHGVAIIPERNLGFTTSGQENMVAVFDLKTLQLIKKIPAGQNPDAICYDPSSKMVFAFCGRSFDAIVIDPANLDKPTVSLPIGGKLETGVADGIGHVYVNDETKHEIAVIDTKVMKVTAHWSLGPSKGPTGLAIDTQRRRLYAGCRDKTMAVVDADTGKVLATVPVGAGVDGVAFDPKIGAMSANGQDGTISVVREEAGKFSVVQTLKTFVGARTITCDPKAHKVYMAANVDSQFNVVVVGVPIEQ